MLTPDEEARIKAKRTEGDILLEAADILQTELPEFKVHILSALNLTPGILNISARPKIAVELPPSHADLRIGLLKALSERIGVHFASDARAPDGVCAGALSPSDEVLHAIKNAAIDGKLEGVTLAHLASVTTEEEKRAAIKSRRQGGVKDAYLTIGAVEAGIVPHR